MHLMEISFSDVTNETMKEADRKVCLKLCTLRFYLQFITSHRPKSFRFGSGEMLNRRFYKCIATWFKA